MHVDFVITNPNHHVQIVDSVAAELLTRGVSCRVLSLCEIRGWASPTSPLPSGAPLVRLIPRLRRSAPSAAGGEGDASRGWLQHLVWQLLIAPSLRRAMRARRPDVVAVCNDISFPGARVVEWYRRAGVARVLIPEGIRFVASVSAPSVNRLDAIAAWGPSSVEYFIGEGFRPGQLRVTGSPRHDIVQRELEELRRTTPRRKRTVALVTNPVDGGRLRTCTTEEKLGVVDRFIRAAVAADDGCRVVVRTHPGEDADGYRSVLAEFVASGNVQLNPPGELFTLLAASPAVVVLGSTVGVEALLAGAALFVLPIPGHGYLHDFVQEGGAVGLSDPMTAEEAATLLAASGDGGEASRYLDRQLANRGEAAAAVADVLCDIARARS